MLKDNNAHSSPLSDSKPTRRSHADRIEQSDRLMFEAAKNLILEVGTSKMTLKEVGERAGYSRGLANARFGSKDGLLVKLADNCRLTWLAELDRAAEGTSGLDTLISRLEAIQLFARLHPNEAKVMYILWFESVGAQSEIRDNLERFHQQARDDIKHLAIQAGLFADARDETAAQLFATQFCSVFFGLCYQWMVAPDEIDIDANVRDIRNRLLERKA